MSPVYSVDIKHGNRSWRVLTAAGQAQNAFEKQNKHGNFYDYAIATQDFPFQQCYLKQYGV